jgi:hypothetical protein
MSIKDQHSLNSERTVIVILEVFSFLPGTDMFPQTRLHCVQVTERFGPLTNSRGICVAFRCHMYPQI